jgi:hypothetical protein
MDLALMHVHVLLAAAQEPQEAQEAQQPPREVAVILFPLCRGRGGHRRVLCGRGRWSKVGRREQQQ